MKTVEITFTGSYEMDVPVDWDADDIKNEVDKFEVEDWDSDEIRSEADRYEVEEWEIDID